MRKVIDFTKSARALLYSLGLHSTTLILLAGCTLHHSKQALLMEPLTHSPPATSTFVVEEDSGLAIAGLWTLAEPDHYAVLLERLRRAHRCTRLSQAQLDFYTDHWLLIAFPIARVTALCAHDGAVPPAAAAPQTTTVRSPTPADQTNEPSTHRAQVQQKTPSTPAPLAVAPKTTTSAPSAPQATGLAPLPSASAAAPPPKVTPDNAQSQP